MTNNALTTREQDSLQANSAGDVMEQVVAKGDLSKLTPGERARYYVETCRSMGLNPLTQPFQYITLNQRLTLYPTRVATDQLRAIHKVNMQIVSREKMDDLYVVTARATMPDGRMDESTAAVVLTGLRGDALANQLMKCETKAKRRVTLAIVGLGWLDESEVSSIPNARHVHVDSDGVIHDGQPQLVESTPFEPEWGAPETVEAEVEDLEIEDEPGISEQQMKRIHAIGNEIKWDHDKLHAELLQRLGMSPSASLKDLTFAQAERCIRFLDSIRLKRAGNGA